MVVRRQRVPRAALVSHAAQLEHQLDLVMDMTNQRRQEADDLGLAIPEQKLHTRLVELEEARKLINRARQIIWDAL